MFVEMQSAKREAWEHGECCQRARQDEKREAWEHGKCCQRAHQDMYKAKVEEKV